MPCCNHPQCPKRLQLSSTAIIKTEPQKQKKWSKLQRLRIGIYRFIKHTLCAPVYLLWSSAALAQVGFGMFIMAMCSSFYEGVAVLVASPFIGAAAVATITIFIALLPIKSVIDVYKMENPEKEELEFPFITTLSLF